MVNLLRLRGRIFESLSRSVAALLRCCSCCSTVAGSGTLIRELIKVRTKGNQINASIKVTEPRKTGAANGHRRKAGGEPSKQVRGDCSPQETAPPKKHLTGPSYRAGAAENRCKRGYRRRLSNMGDFFSNKKKRTMKNGKHPTSPCIK
jgi:hypothetical protein